MGVMVLLIGRGRSTAFNKGSTLAKVTKHACSVSGRTGFDSRMRLLGNDQE